MIGSYIRFNSLRCVFNARALERAWHFLFKRFFAPPVILFVVLRVSFFEFASIFRKFRFVFRVVIYHVRALLIIVDKTVQPSLCSLLIDHVLTNGASLTFTTHLALARVEVSLSWFG